MDGDRPITDGEDVAHYLHELKKKKLAKDEETEERGRRKSRVNIN